MTQVIFLEFFIPHGKLSLCKQIKRPISTSRTVLALPPNSVMYVFDRNSKFLQGERAARAQDVELYDYIKDEVGYRLSDRVLDVKRKFKRALDLGCGRGYISKYMSKESVDELVLSDLSPTWLEQAQTRNRIKVERKVLDEEDFSLESGSFDLVVSCMSLHWVNDLPGCFSRIMNCLKEDGVFMAAVFGGETLYELRGSLQLAELERDGGIAPHVSPFTEIKDMGSLLIRAGFTMVIIDTDEIVIGYPSMFELMWDLKGNCVYSRMGEGNAAKNRKLHLKRDTLLAASAIYDELYGKVKDDGSGHVPASFQIIYMMGWKPHESQPRPIKRGSGEISLKYIYRIDEIVKGKTRVKLTDEDKCFSLCVKMEYL